MNRINFNLTLGALVTKVIINRSTQTVSGVTFVKGGRKYRAEAKKEVIISGGAVNSPQLLMLSGIGPEDELKKHNIQPIEVLPVGRQAKDHFTFKIHYRTNHTTPTKCFKELLREYLEGRGMLTNIENSWGFIFINTQNKSSSVPDVGISLIDSTPVPKPMPSVTNYINKVQHFQQSINEQTDYIIQIFSLHPKSVGSLRLQSNHPVEFPLIDSGMFSNEEDLQVMYEAIKFLNKIEQTSPARQRNSTKLRMPFCDQYGFNSKEYWYCGLKYMAFPALHMTSTANMGPKGDPFAVVDHELKVYGIKNLRVADCSIMPTPISGHNNGAAFVIGEKAADLVKNDYGIRNI